MPLSAQIDALIRSLYNYGDDNDTANIKLLNSMVS
jgi:hypothetical protein